MNTVVQQRDERFERLDANPGEPFRQHVGTQRHRRAHGAGRQRLAQPGGVAAQQVELERFERVGRYLHVGEGAEARIDAIGRLDPARAALDHGARRVHAEAGRIRQRDRFAAVRDREQLVDRERSTVENDHSVVSRLPSATRTCRAVLSRLRSPA